MLVHTFTDFSMLTLQNQVFNVLIKLRNSSIVVKTRMIDKRKVWIFKCENKKLKKKICDPVKTLKLCKMCTWTGKRQPKAANANRFDSAEWKNCSLKYENVSMADGRRKTKQVQNFLLFWKRKKVKRARLMEKNLELRFCRKKFLLINRSFQVAKIFI